MRYFYCSKHIYTIGDKIEPGHWNNFILSLPNSNCNVILECALEFLRRHLYVKKVSRLECVFAFTKSNDAENFSLDGKKIYEITTDRQTI